MLHKCKDIQRVPLPVGLRGIYFSTYQSISVFCQTVRWARTQTYFLQELLTVQIIALCLNSVYLLIFNVNQHYLSFNNQNATFLWLIVLVFCRIKKQKYGHEIVYDKKTNINIFLYSRTKLMKKRKFKGTVQRDGSGRN